jgi:hypothetical protein
MRRLTAGTLAALLLAGWATPALAARPSPRPQATLLSTGIITTEQGDEAYIEISARDADGIITEIETYWGDGSISFAHSYPCLLPPTPAPGTPHRFLVSNPYQAPGTYTVRYVVHSNPDCSGEGPDQHSRPYTVRLVVP